MNQIERNTVLVEYSKGEESKTVFGNVLLIDKKRALTLKHCVYPGEEKVTLYYYETKKKDYIPVLSHIKSMTEKNDGFALLELEKPLPVNSVPLVSCSISRFERFDCYGFNKNHQGRPDWRKLESRVSSDMTPASMISDMKFQDDTKESQIDGLSGSPIALTDEKAGVVGLISQEHLEGSKTIEINGISVESQLAFLKENNIPVQTLEEFRHDYRIELANQDSFISKLKYVDQSDDGDEQKQSALIVYDKSDWEEILPVLKSLHQRGIQFFLSELTVDAVLSYLKSDQNLFPVIITIENSKKENALFQIVEREFEDKDNTFGEKIHIQHKIGEGTFPLEMKVVNSYPMVISEEKAAVELCKQEIHNLFESYGLSYLETPDQQNDGCDGIVLWKRHGKTKGMVFVQMKPGDGAGRDIFKEKIFKNDAGEPILHFDKKGYVEKQRKIWKRLPGPVVLLGCSKDGILWWQDLKDSDSYDKSGKNILLSKVRSVAYTDQAKDLMYKQLFSVSDDSSIATDYSKEKEPLVLDEKTLNAGLLKRMSRGNSPGNRAFKKNPLKVAANNYYHRLKKQHINCHMKDLNGPVIFSRVGWKNITKSTRTEEQIIQTFLLLPAVKDILNQATDYKRVSKKHTLDEEGNDIFCEKLRITTLCRTKERPAILIDLYLMRKYMLNIKTGKIENEKIWFYNIFER